MTAYVRDRALVLRMATCDETAATYVVGSDVAADVLEFGGYDGIADRLSDLRPAQVRPKMAYGCRTVTSRAKSQASGSTSVERPPSETDGPAGHIRLHNVTMPGNCLGTAGDPAGAMTREAAGLFPDNNDPVSCDDLAGVLGRIQTMAGRSSKHSFLHA